MGGREEGEWEGGREGGREVKEARNCLLIIIISKSHRHSTCST